MRIPVITAIATLTASPVLAAMPDVETYTTATKKYNFLVRTSRDSCTYSADPKFVVAGRVPNVRQLIVLRTQSNKSGSACNGIFDFHYLDVNCQTNQMSFTTAIGSPATWTYDRYTDPDMSKKICALPVVEFGTPSRRPAR
jgi:hypothetical protein